MTTPNLSGNIEAADSNVPKGAADTGPHDAVTRDMHGSGLESADIWHLFDARLDATDLARPGTAGKPGLVMPQGTAARLDHDENRRTRVMRRARRSTKETTP